MRAAAGVACGAAAWHPLGAFGCVGIFVAIAAPAAAGLALGGGGRDSRGRATESGIFAGGALLGMLVLVLREVRWDQDDALSQVAMRAAFSVLVAIGLGLVYLVTTAWGAARQSE